MLINSRSLFVFSYLILILGFYLGEDLNGNAKKTTWSISYNKSICTKFFLHFDNYSSLEEGTSRQSPIFFFNFNHI